MPPRERQHPNVIDDVVIPSDPAADGEDIIVDLEKPNDTPLAAADEGAESLREALAAEKKLREDAERRAAEVDAERRRLETEGARNTTELEDTRLQTIENAIATKELAKKDIRTRLIAAKQSGDFEAEADLLQEAADVATELKQLQAGKNLLENKISEERDARNRPQLPADPIERAVVNMTPRAAAWIRSHPEVITDPVLNAQLVLADKIAQRDRIDPNSDAYYAHMDAEMGYGGDPSPPRTAPRRTSAPAAPVSRGGAQEAPLRQGQVRLTAAEKEMADAWGWTYARYAENKAAIEAERTTH